MKQRFFSIFILSILLAACKSEDKNPTFQGHIYYNGDILTMETESPEYVEALAEENGKIVALGSLSDLQKSFENARLVDLEGATLLPGFIDPHSHFEKVSNTMGQLDLSPPPVGGVTKISQILEKLKAYKVEHNIPDGEWIFAWGYDDNQLEERRHPNSKEIDSVLPNNPVYLDHASGHMGVANSMALKKMRVTSETKNPEGGNIDRYPGTQEPNGLVQETAMYPFVGNMLQVLNEKSAEFFEATQNHYAENGITTAQDGLVGRQKIDFYRAQAEQGELKIDLIALAGFTELENNLNDTLFAFNNYENGFKTQGTKIIADGSPQGKTAFFTEPYLTPVAGCLHHCTGLPSLNQRELYDLFIKAYKADNQLFIHCNGDATIDMVIRAHENACDALGQALDKDRRTVIIHSQFVRPDQLQTYKKYKMLPSFFTNHAYFWGDVHRINLGDDRARFLSPIATTDSLGIRYTNHSDATVTPLNPMMTVWSAVNRLSRSGAVIGAEERATPYQALKAITINAAYEHFDEELKGSLKEGKLADFVILEHNPLKASPETLKDIKVLKTIKEGRVIFER